MEVTFLDIPKRVLDQPNNQCFQLFPNFHAQNLTEFENSLAKILTAQIRVISRCCCLPLQSTAKHLGRYSRAAVVTALESKRSRFDITMGAVCLEFIGSPCEHTSPTLQRQTGL